MIVPDWPAPDHVKAVTTVRAGGVSQPPYHSLNLAAHVGDTVQAVRENRLRLRRALALPHEPVWLTQVHGDTVVDAAAVQDQPQADASFSTRAGVVCTVLTADCLPVLFSDRGGTRVAAAHAGWRGLAGGVLEATVQSLTTDPAGLLAWLGPAIGPSVFEVGDEVRAAFVSLHASAEMAFTPTAGGRWLADLYALARIRLQSVGVQAIYGGGYCTFNDERRFFSYRRDRVTGRMASLIWIR